MRLSRVQTSSPEFDMKLFASHFYRSLFAMQLARCSASFPLARFLSLSHAVRGHDFPNFSLFLLEPWLDATHGFLPQASS